MTPAAPPFSDRRQVRRANARAAGGYAGHEGVEREIGRRMLERLDYVTIDPRIVVDLGCATGAATIALRERYGKAQVVGVDSSLPMLRAGREQGTRLRWLMPFLKSAAAPRVAADAVALPFSAASCQLVWSNLMLPWVDDPLAAITEMHRVLTVGGLAMFTTLGPDTLKELRASFGDGRTHTQRFIDMHDIGDMLVHAGFADPVMDMEMLTLTYADVGALVKDLRAGAATCAARDRPRGLTGKERWRAMCDAYEGLRQQGRLPATLEVIYGHAWKAPPKRDAQGRSPIRFERPRRA